MARKKFNNVKTTDANGITHDSGFEYTVYLDLCQDYPKVWRQVPFYLMESTVCEFTSGHKPKSKKTLTRRQYIMDFVVETADGRYIAVEAKGYKTELYKTKRDIFISLYIVGGAEFVLDGVKTLSEYQVINMDKPLEVYRPYTKTKGRGLWD